MKLPILFKSSLLLAFFLSSTVSNIPLPVTANTPANSPSNTQQPKRFKLTLSGHTEPVRALTLSSDGKILASGGDDKTIKLWNLSTNALLHTLTGHRDRIKSILMTPDGQTVISSSFDNTIKKLELMGWY
jgi:COMPASS component SWD3